MLEIPEKIKEKLNENYSHKNIRIHFPNGEREDITNENIIYESFRMKESMCSRKKWKLGLCEAKSIQFECFGVEDIKGCEIEAGIEIDTQETAIEIEQEFPNKGDTYTYTFEEPYSGEIIIKTTGKEQTGGDLVPWQYIVICEGQDGTEHHEQAHKFGIFAFEVENAVKIDIIFYLSTTLHSIYFSGAAYSYSIPCGRYVIDSCKQQNDSCRRKVIAYDALYSGNLDKDLSDIGITRPNEHGYVTVGTHPGMNYAGFFRFNINHYLRMFAFNSKMSGTAQELGEYAGTFQEESAEEKTIAIQGSIPDSIGVTVYAKDKVFTPRQESVTNFGLSSSLRLQEYDIAVRNIIRETCRKHGISIDDVTKMPNPVVIDITAAGSSTARPYMTPGLLTEWSDFTGIEKLTMQVPLRIEVCRVETDGKKTVIETAVFGECPELQMYSYPAKSLLNYTMKENTKITSYRSFLGSVLELMGKFGRIDRTTGRLEYVQLGNEPFRIERDMYTEVWTEEYITKTYGAVNAKYTDMEGKTQIMLYKFGTGENTYYMHDNAILNAVMLTKEEVEEILRKLAAQIQGISMTPFELTGRAVPYLEAGDMLKIDTEAGEVTTYLLQREMAGIISLKDTMKNSIEELAKEEVNTTQTIIDASASSGSGEIGWATDEDILDLFG